MQSNQKLHGNLLVFSLDVFRKKNILFVYISTQNYLALPSHLVHSIQAGTSGLEYSVHNCIHTDLTNAAVHLSRYLIHVLVKSEITWKFNSILSQCFQKEKKYYLLISPLKIIRLFLATQYTLYRQEKVDQSTLYTTAYTRI